jgi:hypothetical protein
VRDGIAIAYWLRSWAREKIRITARQAIYIATFGEYGTNLQPCIICSAGKDASDGSGPDLFGNLTQECCTSLTAAAPPLQGRPADTSSEPTPTDPSSKWRAFKAFGHSIECLAHEDAVRTGSRPSLYAEDAQIYARRLLTAPSRCIDSGRSNAARSP